jgi:hypothetical protein
MTIVSIHKICKNFNEEWFFSTDHSQPGLSKDYVPVTHYNTTYKEVRERNNRSCIIGSEYVEIENPNSLYKVNSSNEISNPHCKDSYTKEEHFLEIKRMINLYSTTYVDGDIENWIKENL